MLSLRRNPSLKNIFSLLAPYPEFLKGENKERLLFVLYSVNATLYNTEEPIPYECNLVRNHDKTG